MHSSVHVHAFTLDSLAHNSINTCGLAQPLFSIDSRQLTCFFLRLDSVYTVKISDGALAQQFYPECYYTLFGATRPVRWAAVETLQEGLCTVKSNVVRKQAIHEVVYIVACVCL